MMGSDKKRSLSQTEFVESVTSLKASTNINDLLTAAAEIFVVTYSLYIHFPAVGATDFNNTGVFHHYNAPQEVVDFYNPEGKFAGDPVIIAAMNKGEALWLSESVKEPYIIKNGHGNVIKRAIKIVGDGLCCPLFGPSGRKGYAFVSFGRGQETFDPIMPLQMMAFTQIMHVQYCRMIKSLQKQVNLTPREAEVLELMSYGKNNPEIAQILGISHRTVAVHAGKIFTKLGVGDRVSAALRAQTMRVKI